MFLEFLPLNWHSAAQNQLENLKLKLFLGND